MPPLRPYGPVAALQRHRGEDPLLWCGEDEMPLLLLIVETARDALGGRLPQVQRKPIGVP